MIQNGIYVTMITPYLKNGEIDYKAVDALVEWYYNNGCDGIFATCQSSEIFYMSLKERVELTRAVVKKTKELNSCGKRAPMTVVASGHISESPAEQIEELMQIYSTGVDGLVFISNRFDITNTSEDKWCEEMDYVVSKLPDDALLGVYEAPVPYKRLLTDKMLSHCAKNPRFVFMKDTCCDLDTIKRRCKLVEGTNFRLYNANAQTLLDSFRCGACGYSGVMANFYPDLLKKMWDNKDSEEADKLQDFVCFTAFTEYLAYPVTAKYHLSKNCGIDMTLLSRSRRIKELPEYDKSIIDRQHRVARSLMDN